METVITDSTKTQNMASLGPELDKHTSIINQSSVIEEGTPTRYCLKPKTDSPDESEAYRKITFGERDRNKPHKAILMVGETGTGKTKLINAMINYMLGVQREDKVWFEITDDQSHRTSAHSQTSIITVYGFYLQESPIHLTIIDTPGYGDTHGVEKDQEISIRLLGLSKCDGWDHEIDAVCLVIKASQNRLSDRQIYIFDSVQSLFGRDIVENIALLVTYSHGAHPKNVLTAVEEAKFQCAKNDKNQPVYFLFDNCQGETFHEEYQIVQEQSWDLSHKGMKGFFKFLDSTKSKPMRMTQDVLQQRKQLEENIAKIRSQVQETKQKQEELKQTSQKLLEYVSNKNNENFYHEVEEKYKEKVDIDPSVAIKATCCSVCEENCHYPGCWWTKNLSQCSVMKNNHCTVCTNKCHYSKHVKEAKIYVTKTKTEKRINEELKKQYDSKIRADESVVKELKEKLKQSEIKKIKLVIETFKCVETLEMITLNTDSLLTLQHIDFLLEMLMEMNEPEKAEMLENIKKRAGEEKKQALEYMKMYYK